MSGYQPPSPPSRDEVATLMLGVIEALSAVSIAFSVMDESAEDRRIMSDILETRLQDVADKLQLFMTRDL